jgi:hypothetical protein
LGKIPNIAELGLNCHSEKKQLSLMVMFKHGPSTKFLCRKVLKAPKKIGLKKNLIFY